MELKRKRCTRCWELKTADLVHFGRSLRSKSRLTDRCRICNWLVWSNKARRAFNQ